MDLDLDGQLRLRAYLDGIGDLLNNKKRRASFALYALGLTADGERKSVEPIAALTCPDPVRVDAAHQRLLHFLVDSAWSDQEVRQAAARHALDAMTSREPVRAWVIDDTGFLKQGSHSVGVQRQYTGTAGKVTNCQVAVSLSIATRSERLPVDFELYLPEVWTKDAARRQEARVPEDVVFKTKPQLALDLIDRALQAGLERGMLLCDAGYGNSSEFRDEVRYRGFDYAVGIDSTTKVWLVDRKDRRRGEPTSVGALAQRLAGQRRGFRRVTWREGTRKKLTARFAVRRVLPCHDDGWEAARERERLWLVCEWPDEKPAPAKFFLIATDDKFSKKQLIRRLKDRWMTERVYEDLKGELGLDHYEGRRFPGWHHHVSVVLCCYAFIVAERVRHFPPSPRRHEGYDTLRVAA